MMRAGRLLAALAGAVGCLALLAFRLVGGGAPPGGAVPLIVLAVVAAAAFSRRAAFGWLAALAALGPLVDFPWLTPGREIYATEVILLVAAVWWLGARAVDAFGSEPTPWPRPIGPSWWLLAFAVVGSAALLAGHLGHAPARDWLRSERVLLLCALLTLMLHDADRHAADGARRLAVRWTGASLAALGLLAVGGIVEYFAAIAGRSGEEPGSFYRGSVALAVHVAFVAPVALSVWLGGSGTRWRIAAAAAWLAAVACLPLTASRGALGSLAVTSAALAVLAACDRRGARRRAPLLAMGAAAVGFVLLAARPELAGESFAYKIRASLSGDFFSTRIPAWRDALAAIAGHPLVGEDPSAWAPSIPLELARRRGLPAAALALGAMIAGAVAAFRASRRLPADDAPSGLQLASVARGVALGLVGLLLVGLAESGVGARTTPLVTATIVLAGILAGPGIAARARR